MSVPISLKIRDDIFQSTEKMVHQLHMSRSAYINEALAYYNQLNKRQALKRQLEQESKWVQKTSMSVLHEFESFKDDILE